MAKSGHGGLPNLGFGGTLATAFISSFFAAYIAGVLVVVLKFGSYAFWVEGLRITDWKHGILSNGAKLPTRWHVFNGLMSFVFWMALIALVERIAGFVRTALEQRPVGYQVFFV